MERALRSRPSRSPPPLLRPCSMGSPTVNRSAHGRITMKRTPLFILSITVVLCWSMTVSAAPVKWAANGHYYDVVDAPMSWAAAKTAAESTTFLGVPGHLATVNTVEENLFLTATFGPDRLHLRWLGAFQPPGSGEPAGGWSWITGEPFAFNNWWLPGEPNNSFGTENALVFDHGVSASGKSWNDLTGTWLVRGYVVEFPVSSAPFADVQVGDCLTGVIPGTFTIQQAVDAAAPDSTIRVCPGTYVEDVVVNTPDLALVGIGRVTLVSPGAPGSGFRVTAAGVTIQGFTVTGFRGDSASCGIAVVADRAQIRDNVLTGNSNGICVEASAGSRIAYNVVRDSEHVVSGAGEGIRALFSQGIQIANNQVTGSRVMGIRLLGVAGFAVHHNLVAENRVYGIDLFNFGGFGGGTIENNTVRLNGGFPFGGILVNATVGVVIGHNSLARNLGDGLTILNSSDCEVLGNGVHQNTRDGIAASTVTRCVVSHNTANRNARNGILLTSLGGGNLVSFNGAGGNDAAPDDPGVFDCNWDGSDGPILMRNVCVTENPPGVWD
jgi:parallel beta-helix repeat protein